MENTVVDKTTLENLIKECNSVSDFTEYLGIYNKITDITNSDSIKYVTEDTIMLALINDTIFKGVISHLLSYKNLIFSGEFIEYIFERCCDESVINMFLKCVDHRRVYKYKEHYAPILSILITYDQLLTTRMVKACIQYGNEDGIRNYGNATLAGKTPLGYIFSNIEKYSNNADILDIINLLIENQTTFKNVDELDEYKQKLTVHSKCVSVN